MVAAIAMKHETDPREVIYGKVGNIKDFAVWNDRVLVAIYERPEMTVGKIIVPPGSRKEDQFQGKACLVLKVGPLVNINPDLRGNTLSEGDWILANASDGWQLTIGSQLCKVLNEKTIHMRVPNPDAVW